MSSSSSFMSSSEERDWSSIPENVLFLIISELLLLSDIFSFGLVCTSWLSIFKHRLEVINLRTNMKFHRLLPMLLIPTDDGSETARNIFDMQVREVHDLKLPMPNNRCIGSSHGWLIFLDNISFVLTLLNPFHFGSNKKMIHLPPFLPAQYTHDYMTAHSMSIFSDYYICKAILSADPSHNDYMIMMIYGEMRSLAFCSCNHVDWTYIDGWINQPVFYDIIYSKTQGYFVAVNFYGEAYIFDVNSNPSLKVVTEPVSTLFGFSARRYIVEKDDGRTLLQVIRLVQYSNSEGEPFADTIGFEVYELEDSGGMLEWVVVRDIGDGALFLGDNHSTYVKASDFPGIINNAIYFTDDYHDVYTITHKPYQFLGHCDSGTYMINDELFIDHYHSNPEHKNLPPPIWILPTI